MTCLPSDSARQRNPEASPSGVSSENVSPVEISLHFNWPSTRFSMTNMELSSVRIRRTDRVAYAFSGCSSRISSNPRMWSMSAFSKTAPRIGECRIVSSSARGWSSGVDSIWARRSGEAPSRNQCSESELIATCAWVRAFPRKVPARNERQLGQAQFHWGNPPPAAEPRILTYIEIERV